MTEDDVYVVGPPIRPVEWTCLYKQKWIFVTDRKPTIEDDILSDKLTLIDTKRKNNRYEIKLLFFMPHASRKYKEWRYSSADEYLPKAWEVIAWMPLPEVPNELK